MFRTSEPVSAAMAAARPKANAATFRADYPDREFSAEEVAESARNREGLILTFAGWSRANRGDTDAAVASFREAEAKLRKGYLGVPGNDLYRFWGQTLIMAGEQEEGLEKLTLAALYGNDDDVTNWDSVLIPYDRRLQPSFAETTVTALGNQVQCGIKDGRLLICHQVPPID